MRSVVSDTLCFVFGMPLVVTMTVKSKLVAEFLTATFTFRRDMVNLDEIVFSEEEFTPSAFSLLFLKQLSKRRLC